MVRDGWDAGQVDASIVVTELNEDDIAGLDKFEGAVPVAGGDIGMAAETADGAVDDVNPAGVEEVRERRPPTPEAVGSGAVAIANGRVTDEYQAGQFGVCRACESKALLVEMGIGWWWRRSGRLLGDNARKGEDNDDRGEERSRRRGERGIMH